MTVTSPVAVRRGLNRLSLSAVPCVSNKNPLRAVGFLASSAESLTKRRYYFARSIGGAIVDHDYFDSRKIEVRLENFQPLQRLADQVLLVVNRHQHRQGQTRVLKRLIIKGILVRPFASQPGMDSVQPYGRLDYRGSIVRALD